MNYRGSFCGSGSGILPDPDPGDPKIPDTTGSGSGSATLVYTMVPAVRILFGLSPLHSIMKVIENKSG